MSRKYTIEEVRGFFENDKYVLISTEYVNNYTKLECICPEGHNYSVTLRDWRAGSRCRLCAVERQVKRQRKDFSIIKESFEDNAYILTTISSEYKNSKQKLEYICPNGHHHSISWDNWRQGKRCPYCKGRPIITIEYVKECCINEGYVCLSELYINGRQKLEVVCPEGHRYYTTWFNWQVGHRCPYCANKMRKTDMYIRSEIGKYNYEVVSDYVNARTKLHLICPNGHDYYVTWDNWSSKGRRCPKCNKIGISNWEKEIQNVISKLDISFIVNDRTQLINPNTKCSLELDIWVPQLNKAIECNGLYWHSSDDRKRCDQIKQQLCKQQGIDLLVITDEEWSNDIDKCKDKIVNFIS